METCHDVIHYLIETYPETVINRKAVLLLLCTVKVGETKQNNKTGINVELPRLSRFPTGFSRCDRQTVIGRATHGPIIGGGQSI